MQFSFLFRLSAIVTLTLLTLSGPLHQSSLAQRNVRADANKLKQNERKIQELKQKAEALKKQEKEKQENIADIQQDLEKAARDLEASNRRYEAAQKEVEQIEKQLIQAEEDWEDQRKAAQQRLRRMYKFRQYAQVNQLMESQNLGELTRKVGYFKYLAAQDQSVLNELKLKKDNFAQLQYQQMLKRQVLGKQAHEQAEAKDHHQLAKQKEESELKRLTKDRQAYEREVRALERESQSITDMLRRRYAKQGVQQSNIKLGTGRFTNPVPGFPMTSRFGWRVHPIFKTRRMHTGVDFGAPTGTPIRAADTGVVIEAGWRGGYGKAVIIDHGQGLVTLYAHSSAYYVRPGQRVTKGQIIAAVGSTGYSTGPHLHMEVRQNGNPVDPLRWF